MTKGGSFELHILKLERPTSYTGDIRDLANNCEIIPIPKESELTDRLLNESSA